MNRCLRYILTADSIMLLLIIYCSKSKLWIPTYGKWLSLVLLVVLTLLLAGLCIVESDRLPKDSIEGGITEIEPANDSYLPIYLGFFFVALSIPDRDYFTLGVIILIIIVFLEHSQSMFYNPTYLIFRYKYYNVRCGDKKILVISTRHFNTAEGVFFRNLRRINDNTFIDMEKPNELSDSEI